MNTDIDPYWAGCRCRENIYIKAFIVLHHYQCSLQDDKEICLDAGMNDYLSKPIKPEELVNIIEKWAMEIGAGNTAFQNKKAS